MTKKTAPAPDRPHRFTGAETARPAAVIRPARRSVLVVEDEPMTALDLEMRLTEAGFHVMGPAGSLDGAEREIETALPDIALLDSNLGGQKSYDFAEKLSLLGIPVVFCTGYEELDGLPDSLVGCKIVSKPFRDQDLLDALDAALAPVLA